MSKTLVICQYCDHREYKKSMSQYTRRLWKCFRCGDKNITFKDYHLDTYEGTPPFINDDDDLDDDAEIYDNYL